MAAEIEITSGVPDPETYAWTGGEGTIRVSSEDWGNGIIVLEYKDAEDAAWTPFQDDQFRKIQIAKNMGFGFKLDACTLRARIIRGAPTVSVHINEV